MSTDYTEVLYAGPGDTARRVAFPFALDEDSVTALVEDLDGSGDYLVLSQPGNREDRKVITLIPKRAIIDITIGRTEAPEETK